MVTCYFCKIAQSANNSKRYKDVLDLSSLWCCKHCRNDIHSHANNNIYAKSLTSRLNSFSLKQAKESAYFKTASLVDICCRTIINDRILFDSLLVYMQNIQSDVFTSLHKAILQHLKNTKKGIALSSELDLVVFNKKNAVLSWCVLGATPSSTCSGCDYQNLLDDDDKNDREEDSHNIQVERERDDNDFLFDFELVI